MSIVYIAEQTACYQLIKRQEYWKKIVKYNKDIGMLGLLNN